MRKKQYFEGIDRLRKLCRRYVYDLDELKKVSPQLRELQRLNPKVDSETIVDAWEALNRGEWEAAYRLEKEHNIEWGFEEPLFV